MLYVTVKVNKIESFNLHARANTFEITKLQKVSKVFKRIQTDWKYKQYSKVSKTKSYS